MVKDAYKAAGKLREDLVIAAGTPVRSATSHPHIDAPFGLVTVDTPAGPGYLVFPICSDMVDAENDHAADGS